MKTKYFFGILIFSMGFFALYTLKEAINFRQSFSVQPIIEKENVNACSNNFRCSSIRSRSPAAKIEVEFPVTSTLKDKSFCPSNSKVWRQNLNLMIGDLSDPSYVNSVVRKINKCKKGNDKEILHNCAKKLVDFSLAFKYGNHLNVIKSKKNIQPFILPAAFKDELFIQLTTSSESTQEVINFIISELHRGLPKGTSTMQFWSNVVDRRSFTTRIPTEKGHIGVHYHSNSVGYLVARATVKGVFQKLKKPKLDLIVAETDGEVLYRETGCASCHRGSEPYVGPKKGSVIAHSSQFSNDEILEHFNKTRIVGADISDLTFNHLGPAFGPEKPYWRDVKFINSCTKTIKPKLTNREKGLVFESMNCVGCHKTPGVGDHHIKYPMYRLGLDTYIFDNLIKTEGMPPHPKIPLNKQTRKALLKCLKYEYFGGFKNKGYSQGNEKPGILMKSLLLKAGCEKNLDKKIDCDNCSSKGKM